MLPFEATNSSRPNIGLGGSPSLTVRETFVLPKSVTKFITLTCSMKPFEVLGGLQKPCEQMFAPTSRISGIGNGVSRKTETFGEFVCSAVLGL